MVPGEARVSVHANGGPARECDNLRLDKKRDDRRTWPDRHYGQRLFLRRVSS
ncbi:hypothetical protein [Streptomyces syringium]|uniref:hypothetical protein n=1 Tax=Streptomyces syringium TaxID=76729 RepID=UPI003455C459